jgi:NAD-dependent DNA ligase
LGSSTASLLASHCISLKKMISIFSSKNSEEIDEIRSLDGIGDKVVNALIDFFQNKETRSLVNNLLEVGVEVQELSL